jgi:hypothetical protein
VRKGQSEYKIGMTANVLKRVKAIQTYHSEEVEVVTAKQVSEASEVERSMHKLVKEYRANGGREWFILTPEAALNVAIELNKYPTIMSSDIEILQDLVDKQNDIQRRMMTRMEALVEQAKFEVKPIVKDYQDKQGKIIEDKEIVRKSIYDAAYKEAKDLIINEGKASTSLLQRRLGLGYGRAARIIDDLEAVGIISPAIGNKPREVFADPAETAKSLL